MPRDTSPSPICAYPKCNKPAKSDTAVRCEPCERCFHPNCSVKCLKVDSKDCIFFHKPGVDLASANAMGSSATSTISVNTDNLQGDSAIVAAINNLTLQMNNNFSTLRSEMSTMNSTLSTIALQIKTHDAEIKKLSTVSTEHEQKLELIEGKISSIENSILKEVSARMICQNNVVIFGMHENSNSSAEDIKINDKLILNQLLEYIAIRDLISVKINYKIGKYVKNAPKIRSMKIVFTMQEDSNLFINTFWKLRKEDTTYPELLKLTITKDKTPLQQTQYSELKKQLKAKPTEEQNLWHIRYVGNIPKLVKKKNLTLPTVPIVLHPTLS